MSIYADNKKAQRVSACAFVFLS